MHTSGESPSLRARIASRFLVTTLGLVLAACGNGGPASGPRGLVSWGSVACPTSFDGGTPPADAGCGRPSQHATNTAVNRDPSTDKFTCTAAVSSDSAGSTSVRLAFRAVETQFPEMWPGALELTGADGMGLSGNTVVGQPLTDCEVRVTEGARTAVGRCGRECAATVTRYTAESGTIEGTIRCGAMGDDSAPAMYRTLRNADGVPGMAATFSMTGCTTATR